MDQWLEDYLDAALDEKKDANEGRAKQR